MIARMQPAAPKAPEFAFSDADFQWFSELIYTMSGIVLAEGKARLVYSRLTKRLRATGCKTFAAYKDLVSGDPSEQDAAVYALTTNHTKFFREDHHFAHFVQDVWRPLAARLEEGGKVRLWSAACSSGEEPYSLVMSALGNRREAGAALLRKDFRILATDLSPDMLRAGQAGRYPSEVMASIPAALRSAWGKRSGEDYEIDPEVRAAISFKQLNLLRDWPMQGGFDAIFCRNVMIYFDEPTKARLQERLAEQLLPGGFLYIGHSERLLGASARMLKPVGNTIYRKVTT